MLGEHVCASTADFRKHVVLCIALSAWISNHYGFTACLLAVPPPAYRQVLTNSGPLEEGAVSRRNSQGPNFEKVSAFVVSLKFSWLSSTGGAFAVSGLLLPGESCFRFPECKPVCVVGCKWTFSKHSQAEAVLARQQLTIDSMEQQKILAFMDVLPERSPWMRFHYCCCFNVVSG